jgi:hypothetical protein
MLEQLSAQAQVAEAMEPSINRGPERTSQRNPGFVGRTELLRTLRERLTADNATAVLPQTLYGLGGVGKTQLAIEHAHRHRAQYDLAWWIAAEDWRWSGSRW